MKPGASFKRANRAHVNSPLIAVFQPEMLISPSVIVSESYYYYKSQLTILIFL